MVGPGALKPKVGDGIKSRRPFHCLLLYYIHSFFSSFFCFVFVVAPLIIIALKCKTLGGIQALVQTV